MRITNSMIVNNFMNNLNTNMTKLDKLQNQLSTGRKYGHISDDPVAVIFSQSATSRLSRLSHYQRTVGTAQDWLLQAETGVMELQGTLVSAYEECINASTDGKTPADKEAIASVVVQLRDHFVDTLNTVFGDKYIYGGYNTPGDFPAASPAGTQDGPFDVREIGGQSVLHYNGHPLPAEMKAPMDTDPEFTALFESLMNDVMSLDVGPGVSMPVTMNGIDLVMFRTTDENGQTIFKNAFNVMDDLYKAVSGDPSFNPDANTSVIASAIKPLQDAQGHMLSKVAEIGGRTRRLDMLGARYEQDEINYTRMKSDVDDADMAEVIMNQKMAEAVYQAALSTGAKIIQPTLMDFLR